MSNNQFTALHQTALSPLCHTPHANNISDPNSRALAAVDTLESAAAVLAAHFCRIADHEGEFGEYMALRVIHAAIKHALALLEKSTPEPATD